MPFEFAPDCRQQTGLSNYHDGLAAEDGVEVRYVVDGKTLLARRWRGKGGEVDLIFKDEDGFIFVEVKKAKTIAEAATRLLPRQLVRICLTAQEYLASEEISSLTNMRIDFAMVDSAGQIKILENVSL